MRRRCGVWRGECGKRSAALLRPIIGSLGFLAAFAVAGCRACSTEKQAIVQVEVFDRTRGDALSAVSPDVAAVERAVATLIRGWPDFELARAAPPERAWQLVCELLFSRERTLDTAPRNAARVHRAASVALKLSRVQRLGSSHPAERDVRQSPEWPSVMEASGLFSKEDTPEAPFSPIWEGAIQDAFASLAQQIEMSRMDEERVIALLNDSNERTRLHAIRAAEHRKLRQAAPLLAEIVRAGTEGQELILKAIGALVAIRDPRTVSSLIEASRGKAGESLTPLLFAIAQIGGKEAEAYLYTIATGHTDPKIRQDASDALAELGRRKARQHGEAP